MRRLVCGLGLVALSALAACEGGSSAAPVRASYPDLPTGQVTHSVVLADTARSFPTADTGWTAESGAQVGWTGKHGHDRDGALRVTATASRGFAVSPSFAVVPHQRYSASSWMRRRGTAGKIAMVLQFFDASGDKIHKESRQVGQRTRATTSWQHLLPVVGFAPKRAATAQVGVRVAGSGTVTLVDDVTATATTGTATPIAGPLTTRGPHIVDASGRRVVLRGVEIEGMQDVPQLPLDLVLTQVEAAASWGANLVRIPLNPDRLVGPSCVRDSSYLSKVRQIVTAVTRHGMLVELDLHAFALKPCKQDPGLVTMPDKRAVGFWRQVASAFKANPLVAFDLYNEPHDVGSRIWRDGGTVSYQGTDYVAVGMQRLYDTVRATGATNLVLVSGINYATQPPTVRLVGTSNLALAVHVYTCPNGLPSKTARCPQKGPDGIHDPSLVMGRFDALADTTALVVDEFGFPSDKDGRFDRNVISYAERHGWDGWSAFTFDGSDAGLFNLVRTVGRIQQPDVNGMSVMTGLLAN